MKNKKIVITGGAGFIGSNLTYKLCDENDIVVIDNLSTGNIENIDDLITNKRILFIEGDITNFDLLKNCFNQADFVFHEAAVVSVPNSLNNPIRTNNVNINGTVNVFRAALDQHVKKVVWASSCAVYGNPSELPLTEKSKVHPLSPYALSKLTAEYYANIYTELYDLPIVSLRYFNVYGPRQDPSGEYAAVIPIFIKKIINKDSLNIFGDGNQTRDFIHVSDVVDANIFSAEKNFIGRYNLGTGMKTSINDLAKTIMKLNSSNVNSVYDKARPGDIKDSYSDITKIKSKGFEPKVNLHDGLQSTIDWFSSR